MNEFQNGSIKIKGKKTGLQKIVKKQKKKALKVASESVSAISHHTNGASSVAYAKNDSQ